MTGERQRSRWVGRREELLALDVDGDGKIGSGAEPFGNRSACDEARCYDGVEALKQHDRLELGGNGNRRDRFATRRCRWPTDGGQRQDDGLAWHALSQDSRWQPPSGTTSPTAMILHRNTTRLPQSPVSYTY